MIARQYVKKADFYSVTIIEDGYGGSTTERFLLGRYWCEIKQLSSFKDTAIGQQVIKNNYSFKIRVNPIIEPHLNNLSIDYRDHTFVVNDVQYDDELFREVTIRANY